MGGGAAIVKAMTNAIKEYGGEIRTGEGVKKILLQELSSSKQSHKKVIGVQLRNGEVIKAKQVISNADPAVTFKMVGHENLSNKLIKKLKATRYSVTSLMFFISVDMDVREAGLDSGNIWFMADKDMDEVYEDNMKTSILEKDEFDSLFISCSSLKDPLSFNGRHHTIEVVTFIDYDAFKALNTDQDETDQRYLKIKERLCEKLMNTFKRILPEVHENIVHLYVGTPVTNEHYINATRGNVYGTEKGFMQTGPFSFRSKTEIENLYMCGASTVSHGVTGSSYSGVKTAAEILGCTEEELLKADESQELRIYDAEDSSEWPDWMHQRITDKKKRFADKAKNVA